LYFDILIIWGDEISWQPASFSIDQGRQVERKARWGEPCVLPSVRSEA